MPASPQAVRHPLTVSNVMKLLGEKIVNTVGQMGLEKALAVVLLIALSGFSVAYWSVPSRSWPLETGVVVIDHIEHQIAAGEARLILPRPYFFWESYKVVGLPGGDVFLDSPQVSDELIVGRLCCSEHRGCLATEAWLHKERRNTRHMVAGHPGGDSWDLVFCSKVRFARLRELDDKKLALDKMLSEQTAPEPPVFHETEWVSRDGEQSLMGVFVSADTATVVIDVTGERRGKARMEVLSIETIEQVKQAMERLDSHENELNVWKRNVVRLQKQLAKVCRDIKAEKSFLPPPRSGLGSEGFVSAIDQATSQSLDL
ncbi:hypothetical protein [Roseiconus lacunae]|uniref:hypothetical protein n=1 Tax=Roseiconus lacunae TaxID=2605694 RepID=UPI001E2C5EFD|nr:hypothetical protein [Roseiconus lacunae]MCD0458662.1 hypothetical protein [Roseiconus lacunae]